MSEFDDFEFREFDRRLSPRLREAGMPPLVPRLGSASGASGAAQSRPHHAQQPPLRARIMRLLAILLFSWMAYSLAHMVWHVFLFPKS